MNEFPELMVGYIVSFASDLADDYHVIYNISYLNDMQYRAFFVNNDGETWYIKICDLSGVYNIERSTPDGNVQIWPEVEG